MEQLTIDRDIELVTQSLDSRICGHCCVAMAAGKPLEDVIKLFGHEDASTLKELQDALDHYGIERKKWMKVDNRKSWELPSKAIIRIRYGRSSQGHVMIHHHGTFYDPIGFIHQTKQDILDHYNQKGDRRTLISHYLELV